MDPIIRLYEATDAPGVVRLSLRAWAPVFDSMRDVMGDEIFEHVYGDDWRRHQQQEVEEVLADETMRVWVAEQGSQVVGFVAGLLRVDEGVGEIKMLAVDPDSQDRGLGTRLTEVATDWIRESGQPLAVISTGGDIGHAPARRTYEKAGYKAFPTTYFFKLL